MTNDEILKLFNTTNFLGFNTWQYFTFRSMFDNSEVIMPTESNFSFPLEIARQLAAMIRDNQVKIDYLQQEIEWWKDRYCVHTRGNYD